MAVGGRWLEQENESAGEAATGSDLVYPPILLLSIEREEVKG